MPTAAQTTCKSPECSAELTGWAAGGWRQRSAWPTWCSWVGLERGCWELQKAELGEVGSGYKRQIWAQVFKKLINVPKVEILWH